MAKVIVQNRVGAYERWSSVFTEMEPVRRQRGATGHAVYRDVADPNTIVVITD